MMCKTVDDNEEIWLNYPLGYEAVLWSLNWAILKETFVCFCYPKDNCRSVKWNVRIYGKHGVTRHKTVFFAIAATKISSLK